MRTSPLIEYSSIVLILCLWIGAITTVFSSLIGLFQQDIKKVIAYSTMSQVAQEYLLFVNRTVCVEDIYIIYTYNSQITKARDYIYYNYISISFFNSFFALFTLVTMKRQYFYGLNPIITLVKWKAIIIINFFTLKMHKFNLEKIPYYFYLAISDLTSPAFILSKNPLLYYITGFTDGEGCFLINVRSNSNMINGYFIELVFKRGLHLRYYTLIYIIKAYFDVVTVTVRTDGYLQYLVNYIKNLEIFIKHFYKYPLITQKQMDYICWSSVYILISNNKLLTMEAFNSILKLKASINKGLNNGLKKAYFDVILSWRLVAFYKSIKDPNWVTGFLDAEGCFVVNVKKAPTKIDRGLLLNFLVSQHSLVQFLLNSFVQYLSCRHCIFTSKFNCFNKKIIPFFYIYPLLSIKSKYFLYFKKKAQLIKNKAHIKKNGIDKFSLIKSGINKGINFNNIPADNKRYYSSSSIFEIKHINNKNDKFSIFRNQDIKFSQWMAGLIDADGCFQYTKKGCASLKITMMDKSPLYEIKHKYGGSLKHFAGSKKLKYKLHSKNNLINLINDVNGLILNPTRLLQLNKICLKYNIKLKEPLPLIYNNGWFSGFIDGDGSIHIDEKSNLFTISITQKNKYLLEQLIKLYGGSIDILSSKEAFVYSINRKKEIFKLVDGYFKKYPLKSGKARKLNLLKYYYICRDNRYLDVNKLDKFNEWIKFKSLWDKL